MKNNEIHKQQAMMKLLLPFALTLSVILLDQITKILIITHLPLQGDVFKIIGEFLSFVHVRNTNAAFGLGQNLPQPLHFIVTVIIPFILLGALTVYILISKELSHAQRWIFAGILGGGIGNMIDKLLRPEGVVDFVTVKLYGFLGMEYWPSFNVADIAIVVSMFFLIIILFLENKKKGENK